MTQLIRLSRGQSPGAMWVCVDLIVATPRLEPPTFWVADAVLSRHIILNSIDKPVWTMGRTTEGALLPRGGHFVSVPSGAGGGNGAFQASDVPRAAENMTQE